MTMRTMRTTQPQHTEWQRGRKKPITCIWNDTNAWRTERHHIEWHGGTRSPSPSWMDHQILPCRKTKELVPHSPSCMDDRRPPCWMTRKLIAQISNDTKTQWAQRWCFEHTAHPGSANVSGHWCESWTRGWRPGYYSKATWLCTVFLKCNCSIYLHTNPRRLVPPWTQFIYLFEPVVHVI